MQCFALNVSYFLQRSWLASHANGEFPVLRKRHSNKPRQGNTKLHTNRLVTTCSLGIPKREKYQNSMQRFKPTFFWHMETLSLITLAVWEKHLKCLTRINIHYFSWYYIRLILRRATHGNIRKDFMQTNPWKAPAAKFLLIWTRDIILQIIWSFLFCLLCNMRLIGFVSNHLTDIF